MKVDIQLNKEPKPGMIILSFKNIKSYKNLLTRFTCTCLQEFYLKNLMLHFDLIQKINFPIVVFLDESFFHKRSKCAKQEKLTES